jgi:hypothetical protein
VANGWQNDQVYRTVVRRTLAEGGGVYQDERGWRWSTQNVPARPYQVPPAAPGARRRLPYRLYRLYALYSNRNRRDGKCHFGFWKGSEEKI